LLKPVLDVSLPALVFFSMLVVGMDLTIQDFRPLARQPGTFAVCLVAQFVVLPCTGWLLVRCLNLQPATARGLLLVAACPSGAMANLYTHLGRGNVALSVSLTAASCMSAVIVMPLALTALRNELGEFAGLSLPLPVLAGQLCLLLVMPVLVGMGFRWRLPEVARLYGPALVRCSVAALAALLAFVVIQESGHFAGEFGDILGAASLLTVLAFGAGWTIAASCGAVAADRYAVGMAFVVRNVGIATAVAVTVFGRLEFAVFATAYFLAQVPILLSVALVSRRVGALAGAEGRRA
jgi:bile acid:Na+ symporter, BASS family